MRSRLIRCLYVAMISMTVSFLAAQAAPAAAAFSISRSSQESVQLHFELPGWELEQVTRDGQTLHKVKLADTPYLFIGEEETLPVFATMIAIPHSGGVTLRVNGGEQRKEPSLRLDFDSTLSGERIAGRYSSQLYPANYIQISEPQVLRDFRVVTLNVCPFQYDQAKGELLVQTSLDISLDFNNQPSVNEIAPPFSYSPAFKKIYQGMILNYNELETRDAISYSRPRLLVIYGNYGDTTYQSKVDEYVSWKRQKGYLVDAFSTATAGTSYTNIKTFIQGRYDNASTRPDYITIIGDDSGTIAVPTYNTYMDYYYTWLAGGDNLGDVAIGRISVNSTEQMVNYMGKIRSLEQNINLDLAGWLNRMVLVADTYSGISTIYTSEYIHDRSLQVNPDYTYTEVYGNSPSNTTINAAINQGVAFYNFRGWINMNGWPNTMNNMSNAYRLFHAIFITCSTGSWGGGTSTTESVVRYGTEATLGGAVTAIGMATSSTHTPMNNCLDVGIFHGIYPLGMRNMSEAMLYGKLYLYSVYGINYSTQAYSFSGYCNLIGDPTAPVYVGIPDTFTATAPASIPAGTSSMEVVVKDAYNQPVAGASVVLSNPAGQQQALGFSDERGLAFLEFSPTQDGSLTLTINKDDYKPLISIINVSSSGGLVFAGVEVDDNGDGIPNAGETMDVYFSLRNTTSAPQSPLGNVTCSDAYVTLNPPSRIEFGSISPNSTLLSTNGISLTIAPDCPDQHRFILSFTDEGGSGQEQISVPVIVSNGNLNLVSHTFVGATGNIINPGDSWPLTITLNNAGSASLSDIYGTLSSQDSFFQITDAQGYWGNLPAGSSAGNNTDTFSVTARSTCVDGMVIPLQLNLYNAAGYAESIPLTFTIGHTTVTDPLGQDAYGYFIFDTGDTGYDQCPTYQWIGIAPAEGGSGTALNLSDPGSSSDEGDQVGAVAIQTVNLPFTFQFYGVDYTQASISSNGFIAFGETADADWRNWRLPDAGGPSPMIAVFWDDLDIQNGSGVYTWYNSIHHYYVVEWYNMISGYDSTTPQTFQAILYDPVYYPTHTGDGQIKLQYKDFNNIDLGDGDTYPHGNYCTIGIEDHTATVGLEYTFGNIYPTAAAPLTDESALFITTRPLIPDYPYVVVEQVSVLDTNGNNHLEPGEAAQLSLRLGNRGLVNANSVSATLSSSDPFVTISTANASYGTVPAQGSAWSLSNYAIQVAANCPADHQLLFDLNITGANGNWNRNFRLGVYVPELEFRHLTVSDYSGNQNGILDPGETATLSIEIHNVGEIPTAAGTASLGCSTPGITITDGSDSFPTLAAGAHATLHFEISASSSMANGTIVTLNFNALSGTATASLTEYLEVGAPLEVVIGDGDDTQGYPLDRWYNYSAHEAIYLASEIGVPGTLKSLAFNKDSGSNLDPIEAVSIYMKNTTQSTLASGNYSTSGYTLVYSGNFPNNAASGWMEVNLNPMFVYDGVSNLAVLTVKGYQQYSSSYPRWSYSSTQGNRARQNRSDSYAPTNLLATPNLPNLLLKIFPDYDMLLPPQNLSATASHGHVLLNWTAPVFSEPDNYRVYRNGSLLASPIGTQYNDNAVTDGSTYEYYVTAIYDGEESPATPTVSATPNMYPPTNLYALPGNTMVDLSWTAAEGRGSRSAFAAGNGDRSISGYRIYRDGSPIATVAGTSYQDSGLSNGALYSYYVTTVYTAPDGESAPSNTVTASPNLITEVMLGDGTSSTPNNTACPINITYKSLHGQSVYTAAELNAQGVSGPIYITGLAFWVNTPPDYVLPNFIIRLKHTTDTNVANWQGATDMVTVFSAESYMPTAGGWDMLTFQTPFLWNGSQNIVVDTAFNLTEQWTQSGTVRYTSVTNGYRCARNDYNDQTNVFSGNYTSSNRPNVKLALVPYQTGPEIAVSPASLGFGEVEVGTSSTLQFSISNSGGSLLSGTITTPAGYTVSGSAARTAFRAGKDAVQDSGNVERNILSFSIPAGSSTAFDLTFAPTSAQIYSGNVVINSNDSDESNIQIPVTGTGIISLSTPVLSINRVDGATQLSWNVIPNATGYKVFSASDPYGDYELLTPTSIVTNTYTDNRALPRAFYKVVAVRN